jgi:hypothetical protein
MVQLSIGGTWSGLSKEIASELFAGATFHPLRAGDTRFQTGDTGDCCYQVESSFPSQSVRKTSPQWPENTSRILSEWERRKLVTKSSGFYRIHDRAKLKGEVGCSGQSFPTHQQTVQSARDTSVQLMNGPSIRARYRRQTPASLESVRAAPLNDRRGTTCLRISAS